MVAVYPKTESFASPDQKKTNIRNRIYNGMVVLNGVADPGAKSTRKPNFGTFGPIIIYI